MDPLTAGMVGSAALGAAGSLAGSYMTYSSAQDAMEFSKEAYQNRYQWTMNDMRKAGLNPIFAYQGIGSGSPSGVAAQFNNPLSGAVDGVNTAIAASRAESEINAIKQRAAADSATAGLKNFERSVLAGQMPHLISMAKSQAESARALADANKFSKALVEKDSAFWLRHPYLRNIRNLVEGFSPFVPKTGASMHFSTQSPMFKGGK